MAYLEWTEKQKNNVKEAILTEQGRDMVIKSFGDKIKDLLCNYAEQESNLIKDEELQREIKKDIRILEEAVKEIKDVICSNSNSDDSIEDRFEILDI